MSLYLVQHGLAENETVDPNRPLTGIGIKESAHIASVSEYYMVSVDEIQHSGKLRARQTAEIFAGKLKPSRGVKENEALVPDGDFMAVAASLSPEANLMLVSHLPFLQHLLSQLLTGSPNHKIMKFQNSGLICLDREAGSDRWHIRWTLSRHIS